MTTHPLAFDLAAQGLTEERGARLGLRDLIARDKLLRRIVTDVKSLLTSEGTDFDDPEANLLWDEHLGTVPGGTNYAAHGDLSEHGMTDHHIAVIGPDINDTEPTP